MIKPSHGIYQSRMQAIGLAIKAIHDARSIGIYSSFFGQALSNLRLARLQTWADYRNRCKIWEEEREKEASGWLIHNFIDGVDQALPRQDPNRPTPAWIEGWTDCMERGYKSNPYQAPAPEYNDYEDGWAEAERN